ncbi:uncharacterized protein A4U43_C04F18460 [Asparagus officinalis]|uniref:Uncharacterized protein n=1 Tax=Asparagus officinalis TaxID=4686 RepID=A0A5P1F4K5_ASPOF|nr:uncharacterized protein LOC109837541 [Asparagus officinalis]ONK72347.1 uncharacterized protein A4U43_C04F18460 [Asparagus officinalis]
MNVEGGSFTRCVRHPSQFFTGFCSSCLVERLSNVDSVEKIPEPEPSSGHQGEIVEIPSSSSSSVHDSRSKGNEVRVRRTLLSLFQLDDCNDAHDRIESEAKASTSDAHVDERVESVEDKHLRDKKWRWRSKGASQSGRFEDKRLERNRDLRHSCDWRVCRESHDSGKDTWEKPRHSWDGSMVSKAFTCSFACLEEPHDGSSRIKRRLPGETVVTDSDRCSGTIDVSKADNMVDEKSSSPDGIRERYHEEFHQDINGMDGSRKKSHRWSRVWDWSITSPFRDFTKKREHCLQRSLSVTCQEGQRDKSESHGRVRHFGNGLNTPRANQCVNRNLCGGMELQKFRPDLQRKREYRFGRSRSVHYPSPGNVDNGLLRFYLTPMRTSRRSSNNRRMPSSRFFPMGILGH